MTAAQLEFFGASDQQQRMRVEKDVEETRRQQEAERLRHENERLRLEQERIRAEKQAAEAERRQSEERLRHENERLRLEQEKLAAQGQADKLRREQEARQEESRRWFTRAAVAAAVLCGVLAVAATGGLAYAIYQKALADAAVIETKAGSLWSRLQLFGDPLRAEDVYTLWELSQQDVAVRVAFVRQLAEHPELLGRFGFRPQPIARAIGLRWPEEAREIARRSLANVASDAFDLRRADGLELITYTRALAALEPWLDPALAETARNKIADAINGMADQDQLNDRELWTLAETVATFSEHLEPAPIAAARDRLCREIGASTRLESEPATPEPELAILEGGDRRAGAIGRAVEVMARDLDPRSARRRWRCSRHC